MKVVGVVQCKNEWGLIAMSVSYALVNHVDAVWILDDGSSDETAAGIAVLKKKWGDRMTVIHLDSIGFEQEAITNTLIQLVMLKESPDWIYPFDADEFLVLDGGRSLRDLIAEQSDSVDELSYAIKNFISPNDFDENLMSDYRRQQYQSKALRVASIQTKENEIRNGSATFFDFGFMNKVVFRARHIARLDRGSHSIKIFGRPKVTVDVDSMRAVHLPMLTRARIDRKAMQGKAHIDVGAPGGRGWQNQFIYKQQQDGKLDEFWAQHSIDPKHIPDNVVTTTIFRDAIETTIAEMTKLFGSDDLRKVAGKKLTASRSPQTTFGLDEMVRVSHAFQVHATALLHEANRNRRATTKYKVQRSMKRSRKAALKFVHAILRRVRGR